MSDPLDPLAFPTADDLASRRGHRFDAVYRAARNYYNSREMEPQDVQHRAQIEAYLDRIATALERIADK